MFELFYISNSHCINFKTLKNEREWIGSGTKILHAWLQTLLNYRKQKNGMEQFENMKCVDAFSVIEYSFSDASICIFLRWEHKIIKSLKRDRISWHARFCTCDIDKTWLKFSQQFQSFQWS